MLKTTWLDLRRGLGINGKAYAVVLRPDQVLRANARHTRSMVSANLHGGASTGPRTEAGLACLTEARTKHGLKYIYYEVVCTPKFKPEVCNFYMLEPTSSEKYSQAILVKKG